MTKLQFNDLKLSPEIKKAILDMGFEEATPIQSQAIPYILTGKDVIGQAQTGTGKTAAFSIPILENIDTDTLSALILCPTRELAIQIAQETKKLAKYKTNIEILPVYGGQPIERQIRALKKGVNLIIGTPGRIIDHIKRKTINLEHVRMVVLDEADEMLNMGFREDIEYILNDIPTNRQTILFSATMSEEILSLTKLYLKDPVTVKIAYKELTVPTIEQIYYEVSEINKIDLLCRLIDMFNPNLSLIFCNTKRRVDELVETLQTRGYLVDNLHGDLKQSQRDRVMSKFRNHAIDILIATDVAARGIDIDDIEIIFNYDIPNDVEYYVHRIGRTGRAGKKGKAISFVTSKDIYKIKEIQKYIKTKIKLQQPPTINDVNERRIMAYLEKIKREIEQGRLTEYITWIENLSEEGYTSIEMAAAAIKLATNSLIKNTEDVQDDFGDTGAQEGMVRLFINIGRKNNIGPKDIISIIANNTSLAGGLIGMIDIYDRFTFVEVPKEYAREILSIMQNNLINGKKIIIEPANKKI